MVLMFLVVIGGVIGLLFENVLMVLFKFVLFAVLLLVSFWLWLWVFGIMMVILLLVGL